MSEIDQKKQEFERELEQEEITETDVSTDGGYSYGQINGWLSVLHRIGVTLLDHIIVADNDQLSLCQSKYNDNLFTPIV